VARNLKGPVVPEESWVLDESTGCHLWTRAKQSAGYGHFCRFGKNILAHRYLFEKENGPIPDGMFLCHSCDTPACVNPKHLFVGTAKDNMRDASRKSRTHPQKDPNWQSGERNSRARFTEDQVRLFHSVMHESGISAHALAKIVGCPTSTMHSAVHVHWPKIREEVTVADHSWKSV